MRASSESRKEVIRPNLNRAIMIDSQGAKITWDVGFHVLREMDDRFKIISPMRDCLEDLRSSTHAKHFLIQIIRQRVYMWPPLFLWLSITDQCWPGLFKFRISEVSGFLGLWYAQRCGEGTS